MHNRLNLSHQIILSIIIFCFFAANAFGQEKEKAEQSSAPFIFFLPIGYDYIHFDKQSIHRFAAGAGFLSGEQDIAFTEVEQRFFGLVLYQPFFFTEEPPSGVPKQLHQIDALFDRRINRHQILIIFKSATDEPVAGGLSTFQAGVGWGYEIIRKRQVSLITGGVLGVSDFGITLPSGDPLPILSLPLIRFGIDTQWFVSSFDFLTGPNFSFTVAPKGKFRFTADMRMDKYRNINDFIYEYTLWYRLFSADHKWVDFAGIGTGIKHDMTDFVLSQNTTTFELQQTSIFASIDLSILKIQGVGFLTAIILLTEHNAAVPVKGGMFLFKAWFRYTRKSDIMRFKYENS